MSITISNISSRYNVPYGEGEQHYEMRIGRAVIAEFTHTFEEGLPQCLLKAAQAAQKTEEKWLKDITDDMLDGEGHMTGAYLRVKRDGKWCNVGVEKLTHEELFQHFHGRAGEDAVPWLYMLCQKLLECEKLLDSLVEDGILEKQLVSKSEEI